jgi:hypothetical protein
MKVKKKPESLYFLGYLLEVIIFFDNLDFFPQSGEFGPFFRNHIFQVEIWQTFARKKSLLQGQRQPAPIRLE